VSPPLVKVLARYSINLVDDVNNFDNKTYEVLPILAVKLTTSDAGNMTAYGNVVLLSALLRIMMTSVFY